MNTGELIRILQMDAGGNWWEGRHRDPWDERTQRRAVVDSLVLQRPAKAA